MKRRGYLYIRFSSAEQRHGDSLRRQERAAIAWCQAHGVELDDSLDFLHDLGQSAFAGDNLEGGGLGLFLAAIKAGRVRPGSVLLVEKLDRFSRATIGVAMSFFERILRAGVSIVSIGSGVEYTRDMLKKGSLALLPAVLEFVLANEESAKKSDRAASAWQAKLERSRATGAILANKPPSWLRLSRDRQTWEVIERRAAVVRRIFEMTANGMGGYRIAAALNREPIPTPTSRSRWTQRTVRRIQINRAVLGEFQPQKTVDGKRVDDGPAMPDYYPRIIDDSLFYRAAEQMRINRCSPGGRGRTGFVSLFRGLAFDQDSDSPLVVGSIKTGSARGYRRYLQSAASPAGQPRVSIPCLEFEEAMIEGLSEITAADLLPGRIIESNDYAGRLAGIEERIAGAMAAIKTQPVALMGAVIEQIAEWEREKATVIALIEDSRRETRADALGDMRSVVDLLRECDDEQRAELRLRLRSVLRTLLRRITVVVRPGRNRLHRHVWAFAQFKRTHECRLFLFDLPMSYLTVEKGRTAAELRALLGSL